MTHATFQQRALAVAAVSAGVPLSAAGSPYFWVPLALAAVPAVFGAVRPAPVRAARTPQRPRSTQGFGLGHRSPR
ncbi:hypothetical protein [Streptomyces sp. NPDC048639]|uniref:hypothetical protein n=1 Tax=Streptomyces sp. NPDC048639 TaxID=3365581 RepID=UPI003717D0BD